MLLHSNSNITNDLNSRAAATAGAKPLQCTLQLTNALGTKKERQALLLQRPLHMHVLPANTTLDATLLVCLSL
jgi:hypothetical protein